MHRSSVRPSVVGVVIFDAWKWYTSAVVGDQVSLSHPTFTDPTIVSDGTSNVELDPTVFEKRFLKKFRDLGEVCT